MSDLPEKYLNKHLLVGITYFDAAGAVSRRSQCHGLMVSLGTSLVIRNQRTGDEFTLPPDLSRLTPANPGRYRLKDTGEEVLNPDFLMTWDVHPPGSRS